MKVLLFCSAIFFSFFPDPLLSRVSFLSATEISVEAKEPPNPLNLSRNWWDFFAVPVEELPIQIEKFKTALNELMLQKTEPELLKLKEEIFANLDLFLTKKERKLPSSTPPTNLKETYTTGELLAINEELFQEKQSATSIESRIDFEQMRLSWLQPNLDQLIDLYDQVEKPSYEKLLLGLKIIASRLEIALIKSDMQYNEKWLSYKTKVITQKQEELKDATKGIVYDKENIDQIIAKKQSLEKDLLQAQKKLKSLEKEQSSLASDSSEKTIDYYSLYYKISSATLAIQDIYLESIIQEVLRFIAELSQNKQSLDSKQILEKIASWQKELSFLKKSIQRWEKQLDNDHLKVFQLALEKEGGAQKVDKQTVEIYIEIENAHKLLENIRMNVSGADLLINILQESILEKENLLSASTLRLEHYWDSFSESFMNHLSISLFHINETPVSLKTILKVFLVIFISIVFSKYLRKGISNRILVSNRCSKGTRYIILRIIHYFILLISFLISLQIIGIDLTNLAIVAGALGIGIGFGLQSMVNNITAGFTVLFNKYLKVGDVVELQDGSFATVTSINLQFTHITSFDGASHIIPNAEIFQRGLKNWTMKNSYRRFRVPFSVAYGTDKEHLKKVILEAVSSENYVLTGLKNYHDPQLWFAHYGDSSMEFQLVVWVDLSAPTPQGVPLSSLLWVIDNTLNKEQIEIPFPQREILIKPGSK